MEDMYSTVLFVALLIMSVVVHEVAHAWMADRLGDRTARYMGRLTLNPLVHLDPIGSVIVPALSILTAGIGFGWAKPVPYDPRNITSPHGDLLVAAAGPLSNILIAIVAGLIYRIGLIGGFSDVLVMVVLVNCSLAVFNLIPVPPLDGSKILGSFLTGSSRRWMMNPGLSAFPMILIAVIIIWPFVSPLVRSLASVILG